VDNSQFGQAPAPITPQTQGQPVQGQVYNPSQSTAGQTEDSNTKFAKMQLQAQARVGANWFYWIAGLSLVNTVAAMAGVNWRFILGLGVTQVVDAIGANLSGGGKAAALVVDAFIAGFFVLMGSFAGKLKTWAFVVGMVLFGLDAGVSLLIKDWIGLAFHGYALYCIYRGYSKLGDLKRLQEFRQIGT
jgi:hypothetical protein